MTTEEKSLFLKDLCARLPYGVKFKADNEEYIREIHYIRDEEVYIREYQNLPYSIDTIKPYLRSMPSITEDEVKEFNNLIGYEEHGEWIRCNKLFGSYGIDLCSCSDMINWLNAHHFDYNNLIEKGLALEAPENMYKED